MRRLLIWWFAVEFLTGGTQVLRFDTEAACLTMRAYMVAGIAQEAPLRDPQESVTVTPCVDGQPPG